MAVGNVSVARGPALAGDNRGIPFLETRDVGAEAEVAIDLDAFELPHRPEVHHARDGIRAVERGTAVGHDIDTGQYVRRDHVRIDRRCVRTDRRQAHAVHQDQGESTRGRIERRKIAQVRPDDRCHGGEAARITFGAAVERARDLRDGTQQRIRRSRGDVRDRLLIHRDRLRAGGLRAADQRSGNDDVAAIGRIVLRLAGGLCEGRCRNSQKADAGGRKFPQ